MSTTEPRSCGKFPDMTVTQEFVEHVENCEHCVAVLSYLVRNSQKVAAQFPFEVSAPAGKRQ